MSEEVRFDVIELSPEDGLEVDSLGGFDDEDWAADVARAWEPSGAARAAWTQVVRVEGDTRTCVVDENNRPEALP